MTRKSNQEKGQQGELLAADLLLRLGYTVVERNWRCASGEADLVMKDGDELVFVEVKLRTSQNFGTPEEAVTTRKQARLLQIGLSYLDSHNLTDDVSWRIDVVAIELLPNGGVSRINHYKDAVRADA